MSERGPLYQYIEFCRNAQTLWNKLQEGRWDWLGRKPDGQFVLGRPSRARNGAQVFPVGLQRNDPENKKQHGVKTYIWMGWPDSPPGALWFASTEEARTAFKDQIAYLNAPEQRPILAKVVLIENKNPTDEQFVAQTPPPNYQ